MKFSKYVALLTKVTFASSLAIGLTLGALLIASGGIQGDLSLDIDLSPSDALWFLLGAPALVTGLFLLFAPMSFFIHVVVARAWPGGANNDA